jgi:hypothetical protein
MNGIEIKYFIKYNYVILTPCGQLNDVMNEIIDFSFLREDSSKNLKSFMYLTMTHDESTVSTVLIIQTLLKTKYNSMTERIAIIIQQ